MGWNDHKTTLSSADRFSLMQADNCSITNVMHTAPIAASADCCGSVVKDQQLVVLPAPLLIPVTVAPDAITASCAVVGITPKLQLAAVFQLADPVKVFV